MQIRKNKRQSNLVQGQSLFELVVAIGIIGLILLALVSLSTLSVRNATTSRNQAEGARLGQEAIEWLRGERDKDWDDFLAQVTTPNYKCLEGLSWSQANPGACSTNDLISSIYQREARFECINLDCDINNDGTDDEVDAVITVFWTDAQGYHEIKNSTHFTDWRLQ